MSTAKNLVRAEEDPPLVQLIRQYEPDLALALPDGMTPDRFFSTVINLVRATPQLLNADPITVVSSVLLSAQLGLEPGPPMGLSWIIPRRNKGRMEASMQLGYRGLIQLAYRSGQVKRIEAHIIHEGDEFDYKFSRGGWVLDWKPEGTPDRDWSHVFCVAETILGAEMIEVMSKAEVLAHRDRYVKDAGKNRAWKENEPEMGRKTVTAKLCRQLPMSSEFRNALVADGSTPREIKPELAGMIALEASTEDTEEGAADE